MKSEREKNRENFPEIAKIIDEFREAFGNVKLIWGSEGGKEIGVKEEYIPIHVGQMVIEKEKKNEKRKSKV